MVTVNEHDDRGLLGSVQTALAALPALDALLMTPVDVPGCSVELCRALLDAALHSPDAWVFPQKGVARGHPVLIPRAASCAQRHEA